MGAPGETYVESRSEPYWLARVFREVLGSAECNVGYLDGEPGGRSRLWFRQGGLFVKSPAAGRRCGRVVGGRLHGGERRKASSMLPINRSHKSHAFVLLK